MALVSVIRRWHLREGMPIREIARRTGLSRNTVRKYLSSKELEPSYPTRKSPSKLDDYEETLTSWLFRESRRHRKQRRTVKQLFYDLIKLGYTGSYDRVQPLPETGDYSNRNVCVLRVKVPMSPYLLPLVKPFSLTGVRITLCWMGNQPSCRLLTLS